jgi:hypothetical protein
MNFFLAGSISLDSTFKRLTSICLHATSPRCVRAAAGFLQIFCHATNWLQVGYNKKLGDGWCWNL